MEVSGQGFASRYRAQSDESYGEENVNTANLAKSPALLKLFGGFGGRFSLGGLLVVRGGWGGVLGGPFASLSLGGWMGVFGVAFEAPAGFEQLQTPNRQS